MSMVSAKREIHYVNMQHNCVYIKHRYVTCTMKHNRDNMLLKLCYTSEILCCVLT